MRTLIVLALLVGAALGETDCPQSSPGCQQTLGPMDFAKKNTPGVSCEGRSDCGSCHALSFCSWCPSQNKCFHKQEATQYSCTNGNTTAAALIELGQCPEGYVGDPTPAPIDFTKKNTPGGGCGLKTTCGDCSSLGFCSWCAAENKCVETTPYQGQSPSAKPETPPPQCKGPLTRDACQPAEFHKVVKADMANSDGQLEQAEAIGQPTESTEESTEESAEAEEVEHLPESSTQQAAPAPAAPAATTPAAKPAAPALIQLGQGWVLAELNEALTPNNALLETQGKTSKKAMVAAKVDFPVPDFSRVNYERAYPAAGTTANMMTGGVPYNFGGHYSYEPFVASQHRFEQYYPEGGPWTDYAPTPPAMPTWLPPVPYIPEGTPRV